MDVLSLLNFWRNAGVGDPISIGEFDIPGDEGSFFDLVFTNPINLEHNDSGDSPTINVIDAADSKSNHASVTLNNKRRILPLDLSITKTPRSPFRVLKLGFQNTKTKSEKKKTKREIEIEEVTIGSLLKSESSFRNKLSSEKFLDNDQTPSKRFSKDVVHKYLNLIKPLYIKVSGRSNEKVRLPESHSGRTMFKHLGKSRSSSSSAVKVTPSPAARSYDSALQQDGIQSAILHCKKSYSSPSRGCEVLSRSGSVPSQGHRISVDEVKRSSI